MPNGTVAHESEVTNHGLSSRTAPEWVFDADLRTLGRRTFEQADALRT